jgi:hypothetical protein
MSTIRVPYPDDPGHRQKSFRRLSSLAERFGTLDGTPDAGTFQGSTPIGRFAGSYHCPEGTAELVVEVTKKPILIGMSRIESELRKLLSSDTSSVG